MVSGPDVARTAVVDERDVADAAVAVLLAQHDQPDHEPHLLTGPEVLSRTDQVALLGAALRRRLRFQAVTADLARSPMLADGRPERPRFPRPTSRSGRPRPWTRTWPMRMRSGRPVAKPSCMYGPEPSTASTPSHHRRLSARTPAAPVPTGFGASSHSPMRAADLPAEHVTARSALPQGAGGRGKFTNTCWCQPLNERLSKWSRPRAVFSSP